jgi:predicted ArsR family transcriptional regulator
MGIDLHGLNYELLELMPQSGLVAELAGTRGVRQLERVSDECAFWENTRTYPCVCFNEGGLIDSASCNISL